MNDYIYYYLLAVNILAFVLFGVDKQKARRNKWRIPEKTLILSAVIGGSGRGDPWHEIFSPQNPKSQICNWCTGDTAGADWCGVPGTVGDEVKL